MMAQARLRGPGSGVGEKGMGLEMVGKVSIRDLQAADVVVRTGEGGNDSHAEAHQAKLVGGDTIQLIPNAQEVSKSENTGTSAVPSGPRSVINVI